MTEFLVHSIDSAPEGSRDALQRLERALGFVPNLAAAMAEAPALAVGFVDLRETLLHTELTGVEREIVALVVSFANDCDYCMAAHTAFAMMQRGDEAAVAAARRGEAPEDPKMGALYRFAQALVADRGHIGAEDVQAVRDAGYSRRALLEVVAQIGHTTMANFVHNIAHVSLDDAWQQYAWQPANA